MFDYCSSVHYFLFKRAFTIYVKRQQGGGKKLRGSGSLTSEGRLMALFWIRRAFFLQIRDSTY